MKSDPADVGDVAASQAGFVSLAQLRELGVSRARMRAQVDAGRWAPISHRGIVVLGELTATRRSWQVALALVGPNARLGGVTALEVDGLTGFTEPLPHVWVPKSFQKGRPQGLVLHETRRWGADDAAADGLPRSRRDVAVVQGALWAKTPRQGALVMAMATQQLLVTAAEVHEQLERIRCHPWRGILAGFLADIAGGAESMNELDFARECRRRGLPEPTRQAPRRTSSGAIVMDVCWEHLGVVVEIQGAGHLVFDKVISDELRLISLAREQLTMIPVSSMTLRFDPDPFFHQLAGLLRERAGGLRRP